MKHIIITFLMFGVIETSYGGSLMDISLDAISTGNENTCSLPPDTGLCKAGFENYFYNSTSKKCEIFVYGECGGNENNFINEKACKEECEEASEDSPMKFEYGFDDDDCQYPKDEGWCKAHHKRFYFNGETCEEFIYGGCLGNKNNFLTKMDCMDKCVQDIDNGSGKLKDDIITFDLF